MSQPGTMRTRSWGLAIALTLASVAVLCALAWRWRQTGFDWGDFAATFGRLRLGWVVVAAVLGLSTYVGRALRWGVMLKPVAPQASFGNLLKATAIGFTAVVLFGRPGELVRPYLIASKEKVSFSSQMAAWVLERILDLLTLLLVFGLALTRVDASDVGERLRWVLQVGGYVVGVMCTICIVLLFLFRQYTQAMGDRLRSALGFLSERHMDRAERLVRAFLEGMQATRSQAGLALLFAYSILEWVLIGGSYVALFKAFPETASLGWRDALVFMGFVSFGSIVQIPGIGGGMQVVTVIVLTEIFHLELELATSMALLTWIITFIVIIPPGIVMALHEGLSWRRLRELEAEAQL